MTLPDERANRQFCMEFGVQIVGSEILNYKLKKTKRVCLQF